MPSQRAGFAVEAVSRTYADVHALDGVSLRFESGSTTALIGSSGSGKSTLLRLLIGLEWPDSGRVLINGAVLRREATKLGFPLREGVYCGLLGPTYETPAEVRMLATLGADAVGMSTVPEVIVARAIGMRVVGISCVTNPAAGLTAMAIDHRDVLEQTARAAGSFERLVEAFVADLP